MENQETTIQIRLTHDEKSTARNNMKRFGVNSLSSFVRFLIFNSQCLQITKGEKRNET